MDEETATPLEAPVETPVVETEADPLADFLAEESTEATPDDDGEADEAPAPEGEAQEAEGQAEEGQPVETYKVKVRGEEIEVPLAELLNGYSRTEDYKAKTAEVAELRRNAAAEEATRYADKLEQQVQLFTSLDPILSQAQTIDWAQLAQTDPGSYVALQAQCHQRLQAVTAAMSEIEGIRKEGQFRQTEELQQYHRLEQESLLRAVPELADKAKLDQFANGIVDYLKSNGFSEDTIRDTDDHRAWLIADKARKWDALQNAKVTAETKKDAPKSQPTLKPRAAETPRAPKKPGPGANDETRRAWVMAQLDAE